MFATLAFAFALAGSAVAAPQFGGFQPSTLPLRTQPFAQSQPQPFAQPQRFSPPQNDLLAPVFVNGRRVSNNDSPATGFAPAPATSFARQPVGVVVSRIHQSDDSGSFSSSYQTSDGQSVSEIGTLVPNNDNTDRVLAKSGSYSYTSPEGLPVSVSYIADQSGYRASSPNLPVQVAPIPATF